MKSSLAFGARTSFEQARIVLIPVPWEVTTSGGEGTAQAAEKIREASSQMDFFQKSSLQAINHLIHFEETDRELAHLNEIHCSLSKQIIDRMNKDLPLNEEQKKQIETINQACKHMTERVYTKAKQVFNKDKTPALVGGDHSVSEGLLRLIGEKEDFGLLHIDAHCDLRKAYQGFTHSHASVMFNVLNHPSAPQKLLQVGIRDFCEEEYKQIQKDSRLISYFDEDMASRLFQGETWGKICEEIISQLPSKIYISLDVDGLEWTYSPGTGTPVPGGLTFNQVLFLLREIKRQGKKLLSFDVVETSAGSTEAEKALGHWNANVASRLIYNLCDLTLKT
ncbi:MAG: arginase family protein [Bdellovibrionales bacterium]|nr:arginase family protein [Bdellovibrionales bacterium]